MSDESNHAERQATEDLLAGFDRPGRSPRAPAVRAVELQAAAPLVAGETVLVTRKRPAMLWPWLIAAFVASVGIGLIVFVIILRGRADVAPSAPAVSVSASPRPSPPEPASAAVEPTLAAPPPSASVALSVRRPAAAPPPSPPPPPPKKPEHRGDFVPNL